MLVISGSSRIVDELETILPLAIDKTLHVARPDEMPVSGDRYLIVNGFLAGKRLVDQSGADIDEAWRANFAGPAAAIERILAANARARICVVGSESGFTGSFDEAYACAKAAMHLFIETRRLQPQQQLVGIAPWIIDDARMTVRRVDKENLAAKRTAHPKQRFIEAIEVARLIQFLLYVDSGYLSGVVIRMHGGAPAW